MKIKNVNLDKKKNKVSFLITDTTEPFANTLRRLIIDEVPTLAIEDVEISKNSSALYDEIIAHRLGLLPIKTDLKSYELPSQCSCEGEGCAKCQLKITLNKRETGTITAGDAKSQDPKCDFVYPDTPIVKLLSKQKIKLEATAILGKGKEHAKWSPGLAHYRREPKVNINQSKVKEPGKIVAACPKGIFKLKGEKLVIDEDKLKECDLCGACTELSPGIEFEKTGNIIFTIENWGQLSFKDMLKKSCDIYINKLDEFNKNL